MKKIAFLALCLFAFGAVFCGPPDRVGDMLVDAGNAMRDGGAHAAVATVEWRVYNLECLDDGNPNFKPISDPSLVANRVMISRATRCAPINGDLTCGEQSAGFAFRNGEIVPPGGGCDVDESISWRLAVAVRNP